LPVSGNGADAQAERAHRSPEVVRDGLAAPAQPAVRAVIDGRNIALAGGGELRPVDGIRIDHLIGEIRMAGSTGLADAHHSVEIALGADGAVMSEPMYRKARTPVMSTAITNRVVLG